MYKYSRFNEHLYFTFLQCNYMHTEVHTSAAQPFLFQSGFSHLQTTRHILRFLQKNASHCNLRLFHSNKTELCPVSNNNWLRQRFPTIFFARGQTTTWCKQRSNGIPVFSHGSACCLYYSVNILNATMIKWLHGSTDPLPLEKTFRTFRTAFYFTWGT